VSSQFEQQGMARASSLPDKLAPATIANTIKDKANQRVLRLRMKSPSAAPE
jgi:hypothetical protein